MSYLNKKNLIVNGDDFGMNEWVNLGIFDSYQSGMLHSASLFVNAKATENAVSLAMTMPNLELGLHINLSEGKCISDPQNIPNLVDDNGQFVLCNLHPSKFTGFLTEIIDFKPYVLDEMRLEIKAQTERFKSFGLKLAHINFHHYLHLFHIEILKLCIEWAEEKQVPFRAISQPIIEKLNLSEQKICQMKLMCNEAKVPSPSSSISNLSEFEPRPILDYPLRMTQIIQELYANDPSNYIEIVVHPVCEITEKSDRDSYYLIRKQETSLFRDDFFRENMKNFGCVCVGYSSLWEKFRQNGE